MIFWIKCLQLSSCNYPSFARLILNLSPQSPASKTFEEGKLRIAQAIRVITPTKE